MRRLIIILLAAMLCNVAYVAAEETSGQKKFYMELIEEMNPVNKQALITLDMGKMLMRRVHVTESQMKQRLREIQINTLVDAMNLLSANGWTLEQTYTLALAGKIQTVWVVSKTVEDPMEILDGIAPRE